MPFLSAIRNSINRRVRRVVLAQLLGDPQRTFPLNVPLPLPAGWTEARLEAYVAAVSIVGSDAAEYRSYRETDFRRFVHTWGLIRESSGSILELGAAPYFTTALIRGFTRLEPTLANFFDDAAPPRGRHDVRWTPPDGEPRVDAFAYDHFNIERTAFPYADASFDAILFCEILEHLLVDPLAALGEIHRTLRPDGILIVTTPNVARLENVGRLLAGANIYDPYSGHGPYGRHNREYTMNELTQLLAAGGFTVETAFSADVHANDAYRYAGASELLSAARDHTGLLGQYLFVRARRVSAAARHRPAWLYRNWPAEVPLVG